MPRSYRIHSVDTQRAAKKRRLNYAPASLPVMPIGFHRRNRHPDDCIINAYELANILTTSEAASLRTEFPRGVPEDRLLFVLRQHMAERGYIISELLTWDELESLPYAYKNINIMVFGIRPTGRCSHAFLLHIDDNSDCVVIDPQAFPTAPYRSHAMHPVQFVNELKLDGMTGVRILMAYTDNTLINRISSPARKKRLTQYESDGDVIMA